MKLRRMDMKQSSRMNDSIACSSEIQKSERFEKALQSIWDNFYQIHSN